MSNEFVRVGGATNFPKYKECNSGDILVSRGEFMGTTQGQYGVQHKFRELDLDKVTILNSSGQLNYLVSNYLKEGEVCKVVYQGTVKLDKGPMKGKEAHNFEIFKEKKNSAIAQTKEAIDLDGLE